MLLFSGKRQLLPLHLVLFFFFSAVACLAPFLNVHMRDLGLTLRESAIINATAGVLSVILPPLVGLLAERRAVYKILTAASLVLAGVSYTCLLFVPRVLRLPRQPLLDFDCSPAVNLEKCANWATCSDAAAHTANFTIFRLSHCRYDCAGRSGGYNSSYPLHVCFHSIDGNRCLVYDPSGESNTALEFRSPFRVWYYDEIRNVSVSHFLAMDPRTAPMYVDVCSFRPMPPLIVNRRVYEDVYCRPLAEGCSIKCLLAFRFDNEEDKPMPCYEIVGDPHVTFWAYLLVRSFADAMLMTTMCLLDGVMVASINDYRGMYGRSRLWPGIGLAIFPLISGALIDYYGGVAGRPDFSPALFVFDGLALITCALAIALPLQAGRKVQYTVSTDNRAIEHRLLSLEMWVVLFVVFLLGSLWGYAETILPWFYADIGYNHLFLGVTFTVTFVVSLPFLLLSKNLVHNIGKANLLVFAFLFQATRLAGVSFISDMWWALPFEAMESFTLSVLWVAAVAYVHSLVSKGFHVAIQYIVNVVHFCAGRMLGSIVGGFLSEAFGIRRTLRGVAVFSCVAGLIYLVIHHLWIKPRNKKKRLAAHVPTMNVPWYQMEERRPNGNPRSHQQVPTEDRFGQGRSKSDRQ